MYEEKRKWQSKHYRTDKHTDNEYERWAACVGACYQGAHLIYSGMDHLDSDAVSTTSSYSTRGTGGMPSQTYQNSQFSISCILETYDKHVRFRMTVFYLSQMKTGLPLPRCYYSHLLLKVVFLHLKGKISLFCLFTRILPTCMIRVNDKSFKFIFQASGPWGWRLSPVSVSIRRLGVSVVSPAWDASPLQGYPLPADINCSAAITNSFLETLQRHSQWKPSCPRPQGGHGASSWVLVTSPSVANRKLVAIDFTGGKLQLTYSGLPPVEGCTKSSNSKVVFSFECGNHVGQPQFVRYVRRVIKCCIYTMEI